MPSSFSIKIKGSPDDSTKGDILKLNVKLIFKRGVFIFHFDLSLNLAIRAFALSIATRSFSSGCSIHGLVTFMVILPLSGFSGNAPGSNNEYPLNSTVFS